MTALSAARTQIRNPPVKPSTEWADCLLTIYMTDVLHIPHQHSHESVQLLSHWVRCHGQRGWVGWYVFILTQQQQKKQIKHNACVKANNCLFVCVCVECIVKLETNKKFSQMKYNLLDQKMSDVDTMSNSPSSFWCWACRSCIASYSASSISVREALTWNASHTKICHYNLFLLSSTCNLHCFTFWVTNIQLEHLSNDQL